MYGSLSSHGVLPSKFSIASDIITRGDISHVSRENLSFLLYLQYRFEEIISAITINSNKNTF